ncbi:MAG: NAD(P)-dependent oxidoreductase [Planctomycetota bacterium]
MKILLTGASSFTGCWFATTLAEAGHEVVATFTANSAGDYEDALRKRRVKTALPCCEPLWNTRFGDEQFVDAIRTGGFDLIACHGAYVTDYRSDDFDFAKAVAANTHNLPKVVEAIATAGDAPVLVTGTVFEGGEGAGGQGLPHFSPYGLSKSLTAQAFRHYCRTAGVGFGKFVIPNPFGPLEEARFTAYLVRTWKAGDTPGVRTPAYIRDNLHVDLLAKAYAGFAATLTRDSDAHYGPTGYVESQGAFAQRFAREMQPRLGIDCPVELAEQTEYPEPRIRINTDDACHYAPDWDETAAWDALGEYYRVG